MVARDLSRSIRAPFRTAQRVEAEQPSSVDAQRAIARSFGCEDLDFFEQSISASSAEKLQEQKEASDRGHLVLDATAVSGGGIIRRLLDAPIFHAVGPRSTVELLPAVDPAHASLLEFLRDCMDISNVASRTEMPDYGDMVEEVAELLRSAAYCLVAATRKVRLISWRVKRGTAMPTTII